MSTGMNQWTSIPAGVSWLLHWQLEPLEVTSNTISPLGHLYPTSSSVVSKHLEPAALHRRYSRHYRKDDNSPVPRWVGCGAIGRLAAGGRGQRQIPTRLLGKGRIIFTSENIAEIARLREVPAHARSTPQERLIGTRARRRLAPVSDQQP